MRRTNRKAPPEAAHQTLTLDQSLQNRAKIGHDEGAVNEKFIRHLAKWSTFYEYWYCELDGDVIGFTNPQSVEHATNFLERNHPELVVQRRDSHTNYYLKVTR